MDYIYETNAENFEVVFEPYMKGDNQRVWEDSYYAQEDVETVVDDKYENYCMIYDDCADEKVKDTDKRVLKVLGDRGNPRAGNRDLEAYAVNHDKSVWVNVPLIVVQPENISEFVRKLRLILETEPEDEIGFRGAGFDVVKMTESVFEKLDISCFVCGESFEKDESFVTYYLLGRECVEGHHHINCIPEILDGISEAVDDKYLF